MRSQVTRKDAAARDRVAVRGLQRAITGITIRASGAPNSGRENWSNLISPRKSVAFQDPARRGRLRCVQEEEREGTKSRGKTNSFTGRCVYTSIQAWRDTAKKEEKERNIFVIWISRRPYTARGAEKERERKRKKERGRERSSFFVHTEIPRLERTSRKTLPSLSFPLFLSLSLFLSCCPFLIAVVVLARARKAPGCVRERARAQTPVCARELALCAINESQIYLGGCARPLSFSLFLPSSLPCWLSCVAMLSVVRMIRKKRARARERAENPSFSFHLPKIPARFGHIGARKKAAAGSAAASAL